MKRGVAVVSLLACGVAGATLALAATAVAGAEGATTGVVATAAAEPPATTEPLPAATEPRPATKEPPPVTAPAPRIVAPGVTVGRVPVGGLSLVEALQVLREAFSRPLTLVVSPARRITVAPQELGAAPALGPAVRRALTVRRAGFNVPLPVEVLASRVERYAEALGRQLDRVPVDSRLVLRQLEPLATRSVPGRRLNRVLAARAIQHALKTHSRDPIPLPFRELAPRVTPASFAHVIVVRRGSHRLSLYDGTKLARRFRVATGQPSYPTPLGRFELVAKWRDPWWYPPAGSAWAQGKDPIPPGPGNPLGTRWMGLSAPYVGIHGTPDPASIGYSASHGCIRMRIAEAEWLFDHVEVGTPVFVVGA